MNILDHLLLGLAAGDSLGSTSEFHGRANIPDLYRRNKNKGWPFRQVGGGQLGYDVGEPTDDTQMAFCLYQSYKKLGHFDGQHVSKLFIEWLESKPKDIGGTTRRTLKNIIHGAPWYEGALDEYEQNPSGAANGSLMRNGVVPGMASSLADAFGISVKHSLMTHYAPLPVICCMAQTYLIWELIWEQEVDQSWTETFRNHMVEWFKEVKDKYVEAWLHNVKDDLTPALNTFMEANWDPRSFNPFEINFSGKGGYSLLTLQIAVWALHWSLIEDPFPFPIDFPEEVFNHRGPEVLGWVAMVGYDSDTYAATAGPLIAAAHKGLPKNLTDGLWILEGISTKEKEKTNLDKGIGV
jgi:ADP-ribosylglycohydrolase